MNIGDVPSFPNSYGLDARQVSESDPLSDPNSSSSEHVRSDTNEIIFEERAARFCLRGPFQRVLDWFYGYDYFISYRWSDGRVYALALAEQLRKQGFDCFLDSSDYLKGDNWRRIGERALKKTSRLVLVGSPNAVCAVPPRAENDDAVLCELKTFTAAGKRVIPINFEGTLTFSGNNAPPISQYLDLEGLWIREALSQLAIGPSEATLGELRDSFDKERQFEKRSRVLRILIGVFAALAAAATAAAVVAFFFYGLANFRRQEAESNLKMAEGRRLATTGQSVIQRHWLSGPNHKISDESLETEDPIQQGLLLACQSLNHYSTVTAQKTVNEAIRYLPIRMSTITIDPTSSFCVQSANGPWLATVENRYKVIVWDTEAGQRRAEFSHSDAIDFVQFDPSGCTLSVVAGRQIIIRFVATGVVLRTISLDSRATAFTYDESSGCIAVGCADGTLRIWILNVQEPILQRDHPAPVFDITLDQQADAIASACSDGITRIWIKKDLPNGTSQWETEPITIRHDAKLLGVTMSPDASRLLTITERTSGVVYDVEESVTSVTINGGKFPQLWNPRTGQEIALEPFRIEGTEVVFGRIEPRFIRHFEGPVDLVTTSKTSYFLMGGGMYPNIFLWNTGDGRLEKTLGKHSYWPIYDKACLSEDNHSLFTVEFDRLYFASTQHNSYYHCEKMPEKIEAIQANADGWMMCRAGATVTTWRLRSPYDHSDVYQWKWLVGTIFNARVERDQLVTVNRLDHLIELWDLSSKLRLAAWKDDREQNWTKHFDSQRGFLTTERVIDIPNTIESEYETTIWDIARQRPLARLKGQLQLELAGQLLLAVGSQELCVIDVNHLKELYRVPRGDASGFRFVGPLIVGTLPDERGLRVFRAVDGQVPDWISADEFVLAISANSPHRLITKLRTATLVRVAETGAVVSSTDRWTNSIIGFSPSGNIIVGAEGDTLRVWSLTNDQIVSIPEAAYEYDDDVVFGYSSDGHVLINGGSVWTLHGTPRLTKLSTRYDPERYHTSPDGRWLVIDERDEDDEGPDDTTVEIWDTLTWEKQAWFTPGDCSHSKFSADGKFLELEPEQTWDLAARKQVPVNRTSRSNSVRFIGELPPHETEELLMKARTHLSRDFTESEWHQFFPEIPRKH